MGSTFSAMPQYKERIEYFTKLNKDNEPFLRGIVKESNPYGWTATILDLRPPEEREFKQQAEIHFEIVDDDKKGRAAVEAFLRLMTDAFALPSAPVEWHENRKLYEV
jgi:hypothetical protein